MKTTVPIRERLLGVGRTVARLTLGACRLLCFLAFLTALILARIAGIPLVFWLLAIGVLALALFYAWAGLVQLRYWTQRRRLTALLYCRKCDESFLRVYVVRDVNKPFWIAAITGLSFAAVAMLAMRRFPWAAGITLVGLGLFLVAWFEGPESIWPRRVCRNCGLRLRRCRTSDAGKCADLQADDLDRA
jgi:hypothetical protein